MKLNLCSDTDSTQSILPDCQSQKPEEEVPVKRRRKVPGTYKKWKHHLGEIQEVMAIVGASTKSVKRLLETKGINIPGSTINYYVKKFSSELTGGAIYRPTKRKLIQF
ncbi:22K [Frog adenovirus 1]|uniref:22K n=1 Tax=Frog adenovirus 1 (strain ATCC VR-896) TaxID=114102 RepID=Q9IIH0_ADEF1|nr:22K [Frog adenovirus 1]AAF86936.1 22K [Frog adenovirus 1]